jgi:hypothetical protein
MLPEIIEDHTGSTSRSRRPRKVGTLLLEENAAQDAEDPRRHGPRQAHPRPRRRVRPGRGAPQMLDRMEPYLVLYDHFGAKDWDGIKDVIRYMVLGEGIRMSSSTT